MHIVLAYLAVGVFAGISAGLFGIGGGAVIVPALLFLFEWQVFPPEHIMHLALGTSLATIAFTAVASSYTHHRRGAVLWSTTRAMAPGIVVGAWAGAVVADYLPTRALEIVFGVFELVIAAHLLLGLKPNAHRALPGAVGLAVVGGGIGLASALLGIGGGSMTVPFLMWCNVDLRKAVATSAACGLPLSAAGALGFAAIGWSTTNLPAGSTGFVYWPAVVVIVLASVLCAPLGARLAHRLPMTTLRRMFAVVLAAVGVEILID
jgi:uncharacterized membrane protein YfcA